MSGSFHGVQGWSHVYNFGKAELSAVLQTLLAHASDGSASTTDSGSGSMIDMEWFKFVCEELIYGAHVCDEWDRLLIQSYVGSVVSGSLVDGVMGGHTFRDSTHALASLLTEFTSATNADGSSPLDRTSGVTPLIRSQLEVQRGMHHVGLLSRVKLSQVDLNSKVRPHAQLTALDRDAPCAA